MKLIEGFVLVIMLKRSCVCSEGFLSYDRWNQFSPSDCKLANSQPLSYATSTQIFCNIVLFQQRFSYKFVKAYDTMPIGVMGSNSLMLLGCGSWCYSKEGESLNTRVRAVSFMYHAGTSRASIKQ